MFKSKYHRIYFIFLSIIVFLTDQFTKHLIDINHKFLINKDLLFFRLDYVKNFGAAFNLFSGNRIFLSTISILITILLSYIILFKSDLSNNDLISYSLILGGTIGNGFDRIYKGFVIDFINLKLIEFPVFNIADISINIGFILILYGFIKFKR